MSRRPLPSFEDLVASLTKLGGAVAVDPRAIADFRGRVAALMSITLSRKMLAGAIKRDPELVPILGLVVGLSQEALKNTFRVRFGTAAWTQLAKQRPGDVVAFLDDEFGVTQRLAQDRTANWQYVDILLERAGPRGGAGRAIVRGRAVEDAVELLVGKGGLNLPYKLRTRFAGRAGRTAPCDVAVPGAGEDTQIAIAAKGFNSTGSKLTDAAREIEMMADVRQPHQFVYAVIDGIGWHGRKADLRRIYDLRASRRIDGLYTLALLGDFQEELMRAARRLGLLP